MKLLAIVTDDLKKLLVHSFGCEIEFQNSWKDVDATSLNEHGFVIAMGSLIEDIGNPIVFWGIASQIRYFNIPAVFVDVSFRAANILPSIYPQFKHVSYNNDPQQFMLELRTCAPQLFFDNPKFRNSTLSASANARRFEELSEFSASHLSGISGSRSLSSSDLRIAQPTAMTGSFSPAVSSIPLGMKNSRSGINVNNSVPGATPVPNFRKEGMGAGRPDDIDSFDYIAEMSSTSSVSDISSIPDAFSSDNIAVECDKNSSAIQCRSSIDNEAISQQSSLNRTNPDKKNTRVITRMQKDVMNGYVEFGNLIRIIQTITRLKLTGMLEIKNDTRVVRLEFRRGAPYTTSSPSLLLSALAWTAGEYTFDSSKILSANAQPVDLRAIFAEAAQEQLPLNPLLQALETEFNSFIALTNTFDAANHPGNTGSWWKRCSGNVRFSEIMMSSGIPMDLISRDIFLAWLRDEICFLKEPCTDTIVIEYELAKDNQTHRRSSHRDDFDNISNANAVHVKNLRTQLTKLRDSFSKKTGYELLGLKPGCGLKALDAAYYAWINRYHADRFVRYNDHDCIKLANELLMLMNTTYSKLSKAERLNTSPSRMRDSSSSPSIDVSPRIGAGRARLRTLPASAQTNEKLRSISSELKAIQANGIKNKSDEHSALHIRNKIRPPSANIRNVPISPSDEEQTSSDSSSGQFLKMSDVIARRQARILQREQALQTPKKDDSSSKPEKKPSWAMANVTPEQHFITAQKKLKLGLSQDALTAITWALEGDPENKMYQAYQDYADALLHPEKREEAIERIQNIADEIHSSEDEAVQKKAFAPFYFIGKLYIANENYAQADEFMQKAAKIDSNDVDTQRSLRYIATQLEKHPKAGSDAKSLLARFKNKFK